MPATQSYPSRDAWTPLRRSLAGIAETVAEQAHDVFYVLDDRAIAPELGDGEVAHAIAVELSRIGARLARLHRRLSDEIEREER